VNITLDRQPNGIIYARSSQELGPCPQLVTDPLDHWAAHASYRTFLAEKEHKGGWRNVTYAETQFFARRIGQALVNRGLSVERPVVILSKINVDHVLLALGATYAGVPYAPVQTTDMEEVRRFVDLLNPGLIFASDGAHYRAAVEALPNTTAELVFTTNGLPSSTSFAELVDTSVEHSLGDAYGHLHTNAVFQIGPPHGAIFTHKMWASNQEALRSQFEFLRSEAPVIAGGGDVGLALYNGGSLYIDHDKPAPGHIAPLVYCEDSGNFEALVSYLRSKPEVRQKFFSRLKLMSCTDIDLSKEVREELSSSTVPVMTALTEKNLAHVLVNGSPVAGVEFKLIPDGTGAYEARVRGPNITMGFWRRPDLTKAAFDEERFYKLDITLRFDSEGKLVNSQHT
jgi:feruloyl-CoA synthase